MSNPGPLRRKSRPIAFVVAGFRLASPRVVLSLSTENVATTICTGNLWLRSRRRTLPVLVLALAGSLQHSKIYRRYCCSKQPQAATRRSKEGNRHLSCSGFDWLRCELMHSVGVVALAAGRRKKEKLAVSRTEIGCKPAVGLQAVRRRMPCTEAARCTLHGKEQSGCAVTQCGRCASGKICAKKRQSNGRRCSAMHQCPTILVLPRGTLSNSHQRKPSMQ